jgi:hypothetical protein
MRDFDRPVSSAKPARLTTRTPSISARLSGLIVLTLGLSGHQFRLGVQLRHWLGQCSRRQVPIPGTVLRVLSILLAVRRLASTETPR